MTTWFRRRRSRGGPTPAGLGGPIRLISAAAGRSDLEILAMCNPSMGHTIDPQYVSVSAVADRAAAFSATLHAHTVAIDLGLCPPTARSRKTTPLYVETLNSHGARAAFLRAYRRDAGHTTPGALAAVALVVMLALAGWVVAAPGTTADGRGVVALVVAVVVLAVYGLAGRRRAVR